MSIAHQGHVTPVWTDEHKHFDYIKQPIKETEITVWRDKGYYHASFSGGMYDSRNPMPDWVNYVATKIGLSNSGYVFYKMETLDIMPTHVDHFETYERVFGVTRDNTYRALVFLEDWKPGQFYQYGNHTYTGWKAGEAHIFDWANVPHSTANASMYARPLLQVTGLKTKKTRELINNGSSDIVWEI